MNVLYIIADQWRGECLSRLGHDHVRTPHLDALAEDGVQFNQHYTQASPCGPSRTSVHTGMYMHNHRSFLNGTPLDARHTNVAKEARAAGHDPVLFGYTDISLDPRHYVIENGYEGVLPGMDPVCLLDGSYAPWIARLKIKGYDVPDRGSDMFQPKRNFPGADGKESTYAPAQYTAEDSNTAFLVDEAITYIDGQEGKPWFAHIAFISPHPPFVVPEPYHDMYNADDMPLPSRQPTPEQEAAQHPWIEYFLDQQTSAGHTIGIPPKDKPLSDAEAQQTKATYFGMISEVDAQVGRLIAYLKENDMYDDTLIVFTSDHGEHMGDHWMYSKYSYFQQTFHIPMIVRDPTAAADAARGTIVDEFTESIDVMPTILNYLGVDVPAQCDGHSLIPFCHGSPPENWRDAYHAAFDMRGLSNGEIVLPLGLAPDECVVYVLCDKRYKYVHFATLSPLLFDMQNDPGEFENLAADPEHQGKVAEYSQKMLSWLMKSDGDELTDMHLTTSGVSRWS
ncbi:MAG: alkaline phosphatase family protein [Rhodospirillales bacterium]|nr:alkaline phosphatase family protein [Rhodospirillales bacterium]MBT5519397.1 alkaline phosphatase family protein [Rhodospirillales bacterium]MBT6111071.1 alkaline phosphatase family protein [Rhodospirillales bacterium]MBT6825637.1 alkaline phosphatase family protein [Rhodospirillales bacterium]MBT7146947.1 alkaline phosphatase family protein [Rhodospirillales bacterium]